MTADPPLDFRDLTASKEDRALLRRFYDEVYTPEFPDPDERESLANIERYLELKAGGWYGDNGYHVLVVASAGRIVAGAVADYLADPNAGVVEFLVVAPERRGSGLGREVLDRIEALLARDAARAGPPSPALVVAEINDPFRVDLDADNLDPFLRCRIWGGWGYRKLDFPYVQPALSEGQRPVHHLLLAVKPIAEEYRDSVPAPCVLQTLRAYLRWAMRIPEPETNAEYLAMREHLERIDRVASTPLDRYVGHDPEAPVLVREITPADPDLDAVIQLYGQTFPPGPTALDGAGFRQAILAAARLPREARYHLWALRGSPDDPVGGLASFFALPGIGFGGYLAFGASLRGRGRLRSVVARIEEQMRRDRTGATGWLVECEPAGEALRIYARLGFRALPIEYHQPPFPGQALGREEPPLLTLAYKPFGAAYGAQQLGADDIRRALAVVNRFVYGVEAAD
jgi:GNAT superfamily N-acetyltransferase